MGRYVLKLYVAGGSQQARVAIENLRRICEQDLAGDYEMIVVDVFEHPELAEEDRILATPTVIKDLPLPMRRVIGDLSSAEKVLVGLNLLDARGGTESVS